VQYATAAGFETIAISHSPDKDEMTRNRGADEIVRDGKSLAAAGGADVILSTSNSTRSMVDSIQGLRPDGRLVTMGADAEPLSISLMDLITRRIRIIGSQQNGPEYLYEAWISSRKEKLRRSSRRTHWPRLGRHTSASRRARPGSVPSSQCSLRRWSRLGERA
jgi:D-arabinose 1-dehydrogenase-like Zn-dependent alcohol dehydrogenase